LPGLPILLTGRRILFVVLAFAPHAAEAQTAPRVSQDVVVTATVTPVPIGTLGQAVTVFTHEDIARLGLPSLVDVLRLAPGVDVRARGPRDVQSDFSIRGATFGQSLILVDGLRLNDSQSGHHNGDIPMAVAGVDRVEIVNGAGSTVHGADALGGTINIISRRDSHATGEVSFGQHGYAAAQGSLSGRVLPAHWTATGWASRSRGFMFDRDFALGGAALRGTAAPGWTVDVRHQRKAFGANGFYGNSPSKEWTDQTLASTSWQQVRGQWTTDVRGSWRNHGDHFRWDINRPGFAENRHRTNAFELAAGATRELGAGRRLSVGGATGGDSVASSNLGDHRYLHHSLYAEAQVPFTTRAAMTAGMRFDSYTTFGESWSPSVSVSTRVAPDVKVRASARHAFRIPTYTELYYNDPANLGSPDLVAERGWSLDGGVDWSRRGWTLSASPFVHWDRDVIDWVKAAPADKWRTTNVRDVTTRGLEVSATRVWASALLRAYVSAQSVDAPQSTLFSKYLLEYTRRAVGVSAAVPLPHGVQVALNVDYRERLANATDQRYTLVGLRLSRRLGAASLFVDASNLFNEQYLEIAGVPMPGRWVTAGIAVR
jgi:iron complex outermembrane receptor protein